MPIGVPEADRWLIGHSEADTWLSAFELPKGDGHKVLLLPIEQSAVQGPIDSAPPRTSTIFFFLFKPRILIRISIYLCSQKV